MTIPIWAPFAALTFVCAVCPTPRWMRQVDWLLTGCWTLFLAFGICFWVAVGMLVSRAV